MNYRTSELTDDQSKKLENLFGIPNAKFITMPKHWKFDYTDDLATVYDKDGKEIGNMKVYEVFDFYENK